MSFRKIVERLQNLEENEGFLILVRCGVFFTGIGKDAVILSEKLGITNVCFAEGICKSSIPVCRIEKILPRIISKDISVAIYEYNPKGIERKNGEKYWLTKIEDNKKEGKEYILSMYEVLKDYSIYIKNRWIEEKI